MVPLYYVLCLYVYGRQQYGQLNNNCQLCFQFCSVLQFKIGKGKMNAVAVFKFIRFIVRVFLERIKFCVCPSFPFGI